MQTLFHAPAEEQADRELVGIARVLGRGAARDIARQILIEMRDELLGRDGILPNAQRGGVHGAHASDGCRVRDERGDARVCVLICISFFHGPASSFVDR